MLLGALTGREDVVFGATVSGRPGAVPGVESMVGLFINTLPVRVRCAPGDTLADLLTGLPPARRRCSTTITTACPTCTGRPAWTPCSTPWSVRSTRWTGPGSPRRAPRPASR
ncbi:hypothetical protein STENM327S_07277 [Streptomyces tendae]